MNAKANQQILVAGLGGQGIVFISRILAETALLKGYSVIASETHGMAQRGGNVASHLKIGDFTSPLIRPGLADIMLDLTPAGASLFGHYLKPEGWQVNNNARPAAADANQNQFYIAAGDLTLQAGQPKSANLVFLGFALAISQTRTADRPLFCQLAEVEEVLNTHFPTTPGQQTARLAALKIGADYAKTY